MRARIEGSDDARAEASRSPGLADRRIRTPGQPRPRARSDKATGAFGVSLSRPADLGLGGEKGRRTSPEITCALKGAARDRAQVRESAAILTGNATLDADVGHEGGGLPPDRDPARGVARRRREALRGRTLMR